MNKIPEWKRDLGHGFVIGRPSPEMRDRLMRSARSSLRSSRSLLAESPNEATILAENAARMAVVALAANDGVRIDSQNKHAAAVDYARARPRAFDGPTNSGLEVLRRARNGAMYGDGHSDGPVNVSPGDAKMAVQLADRVISRVDSLTARPIPPPPSADSSRDAGRER